MKTRFTFPHKPCAGSKLARYRGRYKPRCNNGEGCLPCWRRYHAVRIMPLIDEIAMIAPHHTCYPRCLECQGFFAALPKVTI